GIGTQSASKPSATMRNGITRTTANINVATSDVLEHPDRCRSSCVYTFAHARPVIADQPKVRTWYLERARARSMTHRCVFRTEQRFERTHRRLVEGHSYGSSSVGTVLVMIVLAHANK